MVIYTVDAAVEAREIPKIADTLLGIIPTNPVKALVDGNMLQIIVFAIMLGGSIMAIGEKGESLERGINSLAEAMYKMTAAIMQFAPYGVFALITPVVAENGPSVLLLIQSNLCCISWMHTSYGSSVLRNTENFANFSPIKFFKLISLLKFLAFTTASSSYSSYKYEMCRIHGSSKSY